MAAGLKPMPQFSVEQYDLDFAIVVGDRKLAIEVDGERYHRSWTGELCLRDQLRNQRLIELGWDVQRFWVYEARRIGRLRAAGAGMGRRRVDRRGVSACAICNGHRLTRCEAERRRSVDA